MENVKLNGFKGYGNHTVMQNTTLEKDVSQTKELKKKSNTTPKNDVIDQGKS